MMGARAMATPTVVTPTVVTPTVAVHLLYYGAREDRGNPTPTPTPSPNPNAQQQALVRLEVTLSKDIQR